MFLTVRNTILVLITLAFAFNSFGFVFHFMLQRENVKEEAYDKLKKNGVGDKIEILIFSLSDYKKGFIVQRINKKEIRFDGRMYDIASELRQSDKIIFHCVHDEKEDKLEKEFCENVGRNSKQKNAVNSQLQFNQQIQFVELERNLGMSISLQKKIYHQLIQVNNLKIIPCVLTPPPKLNII